MTMNTRIRAVFLLSWFIMPIGDDRIRARNSHEFGDSLYREGHYQYAALEYLRLRSLSTGVPDPLLDSRIALALFRTGEYRKALEITQPSQDFGLSYLRMYAALRSGLFFNAVSEYDRIRSLPPDRLSDRQLDYANLMSGIFLLERGEYQRSLEYYRMLKETASDERAKAAAEKITAAIENYSSVPRKSALLAGIYAAAVPGAGHWYSGQTMAGLTAFAVNLLFFGGAAYMYALERESRKPHYGSALFAAGGLVFYSANIAGGISAARRYNQYQERIFQQSIRDEYFNTDFIEETSGVFDD